MNIADMETIACPAPDGPVFFRAQGYVQLRGMAGVSAYRCAFDRAGYDDGLFAKHRIAFHPTLERAVIKRRSEFLAGRYAATRALEQLGMPGVNVGVGPHRSPAWPPGVTGSITHTDTEALCVVAGRDGCKGIGIDLENRMPAARADALKGGIVQAREEALLRGLPLAFDQTLTLAFSAKESLFKALYPQVGRYFDFHAAEMVAVGLESGHFQIRLIEDLSADVRRGMVCDGHFTFAADTVLTSIFLGAKPGAGTSGVQVLA